jgi:hypothetical protein
MLLCSYPNFGNIVTIIGVPLCQEGHNVSVNWCHSLSVTEVIVLASQKWSSWRHRSNRLSVIEVIVSVSQKWSSWRHRSDCLGVTEVIVLASQKWSSRCHRSDCLGVSEVVDLVSQKWSSWRHRSDHLGDTEVTRSRWRSLIQECLQRCNKVMSLTVSVRQKWWKFAVTFSDARIFKMASGAPPYSLLLL